MTLTQIRDALVQHLHNNWANPSVPIYYENVGNLDIVNVSETFLYSTVHFDDAVQANIAPEPFHRIYGTFSITVFTKETRGTRGVLGYLDQLSTMFRFKNIGGVQLQAPRAGWEQQKDGWYSSDIRISFYADSNA